MIRLDSVRVGKKGTLRDFGVGFAEPFVQFCAQCGGSLGLARGEVVAFADVGREIVEFVVAVFPVVDEFPIAVANDGGRFAALVAVMRVVPVERTRRDAAAFQQRHEADAVDDLFGLLGHPAEL